MGPMDELGKAIATVAATAGASTVGIGNRWRGGSGVVVEAGKVLTNAHNLHGDEVHVFFADGREAEGKVLGADGDGDLAVIGVDTGDAPAIDWGDGSALGIGSPVVAIGNPAGNGLRVTRRLRLRASAARSAARAGVAWRARWSTPLPCCPARRAARSSTATGKLLGINTNRLGSGFYQAISAGRGAARTASRRSAAARSRSGGGWASGWPRPMWRGSCGGRWAWMSATGCWSATSRRTRRPPRRAIAEGDLIVAAAGKPVTSADDLFEAMGSRGGKDAARRSPCCAGQRSGPLPFRRERLGRPRLPPTRTPCLLRSAPSGEGCKECLEQGMEWLHLRICLSCGHVGCCDQSPGRHTTKHFQESGHPVVQSFEPDEDWRWCYADEVYL